MATAMKNPHTQAVFTNSCVKTAPTSDNGASRVIQDTESQEFARTWNEEDLYDDDYDSNDLRATTNASMQVDLANLTDDEFYQRLVKLRLEHKKTLDLYAKMYKEKVDGESLSESQEFVDTSRSFDAGRPPTGRSRSRKVQRSKSPTRSPYESENSRGASPVQAHRWKLVPTGNTASRGYESDNGSTQNRRPRSISPSRSRNSRNRSRTPDGRHASKSLIEGMWNDFSVSDYAPRISRSASLSRLSSASESFQKRESAKRMKSAKLNAWRHRVTIPKPFNLTESKGVKTKAMKDLDDARDVKLKEEMAECNKKFKAIPVPAHIYIPMFDEINEEKETRRRLFRDHCHSLAKSEEKPFKFMKREEERRRYKSDVHKCLTEGEVLPKHKFHAKPFPKHMFDGTQEEKIKEEEELKKIKKHMRAKELLRESSLPRSMAVNGQAYAENRYRTAKYAEKAKKLGISSETDFKPRISKTVPNFEKIHRKQSQKDMNCHREVRTSTVCKPFNLRTSQIPSRREKIYEDIMNDERYLSENRSAMSTSLDAIPAKMTSAHEKRITSAKTKQEQDREKELRKRKEERSRREKTKELAKVVLEKAKANDRSVDLKSSGPNKLKALKAAEKQRMRDYQEQLKEMNERVNSKQFLFERTTMKNAAQTADRRYNKHLLEHGVQPETIERNASKRYAFESDYGSEPADREDNDILGQTFEKSHDEYSVDDKDYDDEDYEQASKKYSTAEESSLTESVEDVSIESGKEAALE
ncbi:DgyrCDS9925 [Dimorphilus gyrociliatus]|uniref:DgyrCDS9925 n=1 Tax=Dimorphilus gyrociliatus TaxID=2664684 RepID=A0A7I8VZS1_9ANNE|nr:DgyrCDS9925 [Dimorphilus gyrociliatus]